MTPAQFKEKKDALKALIENGQTEKAHAAFWAAAETMTDTEVVAMMKIITAQIDGAA